MHIDQTTSDKLLEIQQRHTKLDEFISGKRLGTYHLDPESMHRDIAELLAILHAVEAYRLGLEGMHGHSPAQGTCRNIAQELKRIVL